MVRGIYEIIYRALGSISEVTGLTYNEVNVVAYYILLPLIYICLIDRIRNNHTLKKVFLTGWALLLIFIPDFEPFADVLFYLAAGFLEVFAFLGLGYVGASVLFCVIVPLAIFLALLHRAFPDLAERILNRESAD